jgi:hypothetical protein
MVWSGAVTTANEAMNFREYFVAPKKIINSILSVRIGHFMMASILLDLS